MRYFKILIDRKNKPGHWTAFEIETSRPMMGIHYTRNNQFKQWFCYATIFPFYFSKNNCVLQFGIYLIWLKIGFRVMGSFYSGVKREKHIKKLDLKFSL